MALILALTIAQTFQSQSLPPKLPNIGYLGSGYDIVKGNPVPTSGTRSTADPGFKLGIANFTYNSGSTTADGTYSIPDYTDARAIPSCSFSSSATQNTGQTSYSSQLSESVSVDADVHSIFAKVSFSASASYQKMTHSTYKYKNVYVSSAGFCAAYEAYLEPVSFRVNDEFIAEVGILPPTIDQSNPLDPYYVFISRYGTNYVNQIKMGSQYTRTYEFDQQSWSSMNFQKWNIDVTAKVEFSVFTGSASSDTQQQIQQAKEYEQLSANLYETVLGSDPPTNGNISTWNISSFASPYPYYYALSSISDLFTTNYIPNESSSNLTIKQNNMLKALQNYCGMTPGCGNYQPDIDPQFIQTYTSNLASTNLGYATCPQGFKVISCGFTSNNIGGGMDGDYEVFWAAFPINDYQCAGYDAFSGTIYAVCVPDDIVGNLKIVQKDFVGDINVACPSGYKATGCGLTKHYNNPPQYREEYPQVFPNSDGNSCHCYDDVPGGTCYVMCSDSIANSRVYQNSGAVGTGNVDVPCEGESMVLGCGINMHIQTNTRQWEPYLQFYVNNYNSCHGYSYWPYTVYALCGEFKGKNGTSGNETLSKLS